MALFSWLFGSKKQQNRVFARIEGDGSFGLEIVGESHYQNALEKLAGGKTEEGCELQVEAMLVHDDHNQHDNQAVAISIDGEIVGYLSRKHARQFRNEMKKAGQPGTPAVCNALIVGGWDRGRGDTGHFGVKLDLPIVETDD